MTARHTLGSLLLVAAGASAAHAEDWNTSQHIEHFAGSALLAGVATAATHSELEGFGIAFGIGFAKEEVDQWRYRRAVGEHCKPQYAFTAKSLASDALGSYVGAKVAGLALHAQSHGFSVVLERRF